MPETPAAEAADKISLFLASFRPYLGKRYARMLPVQQAMWTMGPSLPRLSPEATANMMATAFIRKVHLPR